MLDFFFYNGSAMKLLCAVAVAATAAAAAAAAAAAGAAPGAAQLDFPLTVSRPEPGEPSDGQPTSFSCALGAGLAMEATECQWTDPAGATFVADVDTGQVTPGGGGMTAFGDEATCGLNIDSFDPASHEGVWSCRLEVAGDEAFRMGTFQLLSEGEPTDVRLPRHAVPSGYHLDLAALMGVGLVEGRVEMDFAYEGGEDAAEYSRKIAVNVYDVVVKEDTVEVANSLGQNSVVGHEYDVDRGQYLAHLELELSSEASLNEYILSMEFTSVIGNGFFSTSYVDVETGEETWMAVTDLEGDAPFGARTVFPCMDEPDRKATFTLSLTHDASLVTALSNAEVVDTTDAVGMPGYVTDTFGTTEEMSTYLFAMSMSEFVLTETADERIRIWHRRGVEDFSLVAADAAPVILAYLEDYADIPYPLEKLDMVTIPDFDSVGMENWGMVTFDEQTMFHDSSSSSDLARDNAVHIIAHEFAHMWFGDLVTMAWWDDVWLNEGTYSTS